MQTEYDGWGCCLALAHDGMQDEQRWPMVNIGTAFQQLRHVHDGLGDLILEEGLTQRPTQVSQQRLGARVRAPRHPVENFRQLGKSPFFARATETLGNSVCTTTSIIIQQHPR